MGTFVPRGEGKILIAANGAYGLRMVHMCEAIGINNTVYKVNETESFNTDVIEQMLQEDQDITHVAVVHCETTTGILNPIEEVCCIAKRYNKMTIVDAMSSFGGIPMDIEQLQIDLLISSSNKCIQGVPGFGFVIAKTDELEKCKGNAHSLSLDLYDQYKTMERDKGNGALPLQLMRFGHFIRLSWNLKKKGVQARFKRYRENQHLLVTGMRKLGFNTLLQSKQQSPIITSFLYPNDSLFTFQGFYQSLKNKVSSFTQEKFLKLTPLELETLETYINKILKGC
ncbi:2-aminoethylphosphonate--pyruvate transaminase [Priestia megaterium]